MNQLKLYDLLNESNERDVFEGFDEINVRKEYQQNFDLNRFKNINTYDGKLKYLRKIFGKSIGWGSARIVYRIDDTKVLKIAKNKVGVIQNKIEISWGAEKYYDDILTKVFDYDKEDFLWVEMEFAIRAQKSDFERLWGISHDDIIIYFANIRMQETGNRLRFKQDKDIKDKLDNTSEILDMVTFMYDAESPSGDLVKIDSWGIVNRNGREKLVLIDFGLTNELYESYYS